MLNEIRGSRPFPIDHERQRRCAELLESYGMTITELAFHLSVSQPLISEVISGRRISPTNENRIADFFGVPHDVLFPLRTAGEIAFMREQEAQKKAENEKKKRERMALRESAIARASGAA